MSSELSIKVDNLSKCYQIYEQPRDRLKQFILPRLQNMVGKKTEKYYREFWALKSVSFEVRRGETVGVIGRNGSGKSTLLQMICGTLNPTGGSVQTHGRIAALLELGSGFNPDFTGRENIYLNAAVLGLNRDEIDACYEDIVAFADIGEFINQPVKTYSSGMVVRLAFAVQAQVSPDILIVDEALAVGDAKFQAKCFECLRQLKSKGTSILLVTHSSEQIVAHCSKAILLDAGRTIEYGEPRHVVNRYMDILFGKEKKEIDVVSGNDSEVEKLKEESPRTQLNTIDDVFSTHPGYNHHEYRWGDGAAKILDYCLSANGEDYPAAVSTGQSIVLRISIKFLSELIRPIFGLTIKTREGVTVYGVNSETLGVRDFQSLGASGSVVEVKAVFNCRLASGDYFVSLGIATNEGGEVIPHDRRYDAVHFQVRPEEKFFGLVDVGINLTAGKL